MATRAVYVEDHTSSLGLHAGFLVFLRA